MSKLKVELNEAEVGKLLKSAEIAAACREQADQIQRRCGDGYIVTTYVGKTRVNASVYAKTAKAKRDNNQNNTLLKALRG